MSGTALAYAKTKTSIDVLPAGAKARTVNISKFGRCAEGVCPFAVQAVSDSGDYVALGHGNTDPSHVYRTVLVYDTVAKKRMSLGTIEHVFFRADGAVLVTAAQVKVFDPL